MSTGEREGAAVVVELGVVPVAGVVAFLALEREPCRSVVGVGAVVVVAVTGGAVGGCALVAVGVAALTVENEVRAGQSEGGEVVIELGPLPAVGAVAELTLERKSGRRVVGVASVVVVTAMAGRAVGGRVGEAVRMAVVAFEREVGAGESEGSSIVVESGGVPAVDAVALLAGGREACHRMIGIRGALVVVEVAGNAVGGRVGEAVRVAVLTVGAQMAAGQPEGRRMLEGDRTLPAGGER